MADLQSAPSPSSGKEPADFSLTSPSTRSSQIAKYDVFINNRGPNVKKTLASILYETLISAGLRVFLDTEELELGDDIPDTLKRVIRSSSVHIAILSENYAQSAWCLAELELMLEIGAKIVPVFYNVSVSVPRYCQEPYAGAFCEHERKARYSKYQIKKWKDALYEVSMKSGCKWNDNNNDQGKLLKEIVDTVEKEVQRRKPLDVPQHPVGLEEAVEDFNRRWESEKNPKLVGIVGMGGSGKTTLAEKLFNLRRSAFDASCFLSDVRKKSAMNNLQTLQGQLLEDLLHFRCKIGCVMKGKEILRSRLAKVRTTSRFLIILDDIDRMGQIDDLLVEDLLRTDSMIIITSRDMSLFRRNAKAMLYEMKLMGEKHARELFCLHAFHQRFPESGFESVVDMFLTRCNGLPLSLKVCGALLSAKSGINEWNYQLFKFSKAQIDYYVPGGNEKVIMSLAYQELTEDDQDNFLDICSFFSGWDWETVASIVGDEELLTLARKNLVARVFDEVKVCHAAVGISRELSKGLRITTTEELSSVLEQEQDVEKIKGIWLMDNKVRFELPAEKLDLMHRSLRVLALGDWMVTKGTCNNRFENLRFLQAGNVPYLPFNIANLHQLRFLQNGCGQEMGFSVAENIPPTLRKLDLCKKPYCVGLELISQMVIKLQNLRSLEFKEFVGLFMLPEEFQLLSQLIRLDLTGCSLLKLPKGLGQLNALEHLDLSCCRGLKELPESIGQLQSLTTLNLQFCTKLSQIPNSFGQLKRLRTLKLKGCCSLQNLPDRLGLLTSLEDLNLHGCKKLILLPASFNQLSSLRNLNLNKCQTLLSLPDKIGYLPLLSFKMQKCSNLRKLPSSMGRLTSLLRRDMSMNGCLALKKLPEKLCRLICMERLDLSSCTALQRLPYGFKDFRSITYLNLEMCENIGKLPEGFGRLSFLRELNLDSCIKLEELCSDFESLSSLEKLILRNCQSLKGKWMDTIVKIKSLKTVDITESCELTKRWKEIRSGKTEWDEIVKFYQTEDEMMRKAASMVFGDECLLFDAYGEEVRPSTLVPNTTLVIVFHRHISEDGWKELVEKIKALHNTSLYLRIIHVTNYTPNLASSDNEESMVEPKVTPLGLYFKSTAVLSAFQRILSLVVGSADLQGDYVVTTTVEADSKGIKQFSRWDNISGLLKQTNFKSETCLHINKLLEAPQENNLELLRALLVTKGRDFLLRKGIEQVKVDALRGLEVVLLLISRIEICEIQISILKEMYTKMRNRQYAFEVVWMPIANLDDNDTWGSYVRAASAMPWLAVADPWSMEPEVLELVKQDWNFGHDSSRSILVAVDEKGTIINNDAMEMVCMWGLEAYPFAGDAWDDLWESEWEQLNKMSSLEFLFQNQDSLDTMKEAILQRRMIWLYGGDPLEISNFTPKLNSGLSKLDACNVQITYIGGPSFPLAIEFMNTQETIFYEKSTESISWPSLSFPDALRFWRRVENLWWELRNKGGSEMFKRLRELLVALLSLNNISRSIPDASAWIVAMDENGEMVTAWGKDVINALVDGSTISPDIKEDLIEGSKRGELAQVIKRRFQDDVITSPHHYYGRHPLLPFSVEYYPWPGVVCDVCGKEIMAELLFFKCSVCEDTNICKLCMPDKVIFTNSEVIRSSLIGKHTLKGNRNRDPWKMPVLPSKPMGVVQAASSRKISSTFGRRADGNVVRRNLI